MKSLLAVAVPLIALLTTPATAREVTDFTLDNGMQVVVIEDHRAPVVVNMVWYRVGAADEAPGKSGIAHFFEHLMFKPPMIWKAASCRVSSRPMAGPTTPLPARITPPISSVWRPTGWG